MQKPSIPSSSQQGSVLPVRYLSSRSQMERLEYGSTPEVGSSRITTLAPPTNAKATDNFLCMPPESDHHDTLSTGLHHSEH